MSLAFSGHPNKVHHRCHPVAVFLLIILILAHRCLTRKARPTTQATDLEKTSFLRIDPRLPAGHFMTTARSCLEVVGCQLLSFQAGENSPVAGKDRHCGAGLQIDQYVIRWCFEILRQDILCTF